MTGISSQEDYKNTTGIARFVQSNYRSATEGKANEECSDADEDGEQQLFTHCQSKEEFIKLKQVSAIGQQLKEIGP